MTISKDTKSTKERERERERERNHFVTFGEFGEFCVNVASAEVEALSTAGWPHGAERASDVAGRLGDENPAVLSLVEF